MPGYDPGPCWLPLFLSRPWPARPLPLGPPDDQRPLVSGSAVNRERSQSAGREAPLTADPETEIIGSGEAEVGPDLAARCAKLVLPPLPAHSAPVCSVDRYAN